VYRFWDVVTGPILEALGPKVVVEIGSDHGPNTKKLLEYCHEHGATLHAIDPLPKYDVEEWQREHGERLVFHKALSLEALPTIADADAVLIDGDHNWYTVYNELREIEARAQAASRPFPLIMMHDVGWPYARRDGYYDPESIPEEYRQPHEKRGLAPGSSELSKEGGYNSTVDNAIVEGGPRNGVLTAVEDFLRETDREIEFLRLEGLHGIAVLLPQPLKAQNPELAAVVDSLRPTPVVARYVELLERARLDSEIGRVLAESRRHDADVRRQAADARRQELLRRNEDLKLYIETIQNTWGWQIASGLGNLGRKVRKGR
jgi:hypothetical protein